MATSLPLTLGSFLDLLCVGKACTACLHGTLPFFLTHKLAQALVVLAHWTLAAFLGHDWA